MKNNNVATQVARAATQQKAIIGQRAGQTPKKQGTSEVRTNMFSAGRMRPSFGT